MDDVDVDSAMNDVDCVTDDADVDYVNDDITVHCVQGPNAIHEFPITFHYVHPDDMKMLHYFIYNISPYGISYNFTAT